MNNFDGLSLTSPTMSTFADRSPPLTGTRLPDYPSTNHPQPHSSASASSSRSRNNDSYSSRIPPDEQYHSGDEGGDSKRRRIARACDMCRKKKIKCDGKLPKCTHCVNYKTECVTTHVEKKRNPPKGAKYIEGLENRLSRMERLLRLSGVSSEFNSAKTDLSKLEERLMEKSRSLANGTNQDRDALNDAGDDEPTSDATVHCDSASRSDAENFDESPFRPDHHQRSSSRTSGSRDGTSEKDSWKDKSTQSEMLCSLVTDDYSMARYMGPSSAFSLFSPKGAQWVNERTGDHSFQDLFKRSMSDSEVCSYVRPEVYEVAMARTVHEPLPPRAEALSLFRDYFDNFNFIVPLFHEPTFMHLVERQYSGDPYKSGAWWACINVVLSLAHTLRALNKINPREEQKKSWLYFKNALGVFTELALLNTDLLTVQALLGMTIIMQGSQNPQPSFFLLANAIRAAHAIGLHRRGTAFNLNPVELEQRKRVFWIAYLFDKDISIRSGRPSVQDDSDMNVDLPLQDPPDGVGNVPLLDGRGKANYFRIICRFGLITSKVYSRLYSTRASRQSDGELLNVIGELDRELEEWKESIPPDFQPDSGIRITHRPLVLHIIAMHFAYYNCLATVHRMSVHHGYFSSRLSNYAIQGLNSQPLNPRIFSSSSICVQAARSTIHLVKFIPREESCIGTWTFLYYPIAALVTLFAHIIQNPQDLRARSDVKLMSIVINYLSSLTSIELEEPDHGVRRKFHVCRELERIANSVIDKAEKESVAQQNTSNKSDFQHQNEDVAKHVVPVTNTKRQTGDNASRGHDTSPSPLAGSSPHFAGGNHFMSNPVSERNTQVPAAENDMQQGQAAPVSSAMPPNILGTNDPMSRYNTYVEPRVQMPEMDPSAATAAANPVPFTSPLEKPPPFQDPSIAFADPSTFPPYGQMDVPGLATAPPSSMEAQSFPMGLDWEWPELGMANGLGFGLSSFMGGTGAWASMGGEDTENAEGNNVNNMQGGEKRC